MFLLFYKFSIGAFVLLLRFASLFNSRARKMVVGRRKWRRGGGLNADGRDNSPTFCVHCASLGEFEQGRPLIESLRARYPDVRLVLTFFSPSGYDVRSGYEGVDEVCYLPFDRRGDVSRFLAYYRPERFYVVKYEYWYYLLRGLRGIGCEVYLFSAIFRGGQSFFRVGFWGSMFGGNFYRRILGFFSGIYVQDDSSAVLLRGIGVDSVVAGDTRFDRVLSLACDARPIVQLASFVASAEFVVVCGSTWPADDALLLDLMKAHPQWRFVVAPHQISHSYIDGFIARSGRPAVRYSECSGGGYFMGNAPSLFVIDTIGILGSAYQYGHVAYIGGGFGAGIHNTLEAATWGLPVVFGPRYSKFREARDLISCGGGFSVSDTAALLSVFDGLRGGYTAAGAAARDYVHSRAGATGRILGTIE